METPVWALRHILTFLARRDVARMIVSAFDSGDRSRGEWLLRGDAYPLVIEETECIHVAVAEGCWRAALTLLGVYARERPHFKTRKFKQNASGGKPSPFQEFCAKHERQPFVFPSEVAYRCAERGDQHALEWLLTAGGFKVDEALRRAASAKQFELLEWLLNVTHEVKTVLRQDESGSLRAVAWLYSSWFESTALLCAATNDYGMSEIRVNVERGKTKDYEYFPLADLYAVHGDLASLQKVLELPDPKRFFTRETIIKAAAAGHLNVVQWLVSLDFRKWNLVGAASHAAKHGHVAVVQWLFKTPETRQSPVLHQAIEGGHLELCRWIWKQLPPPSSSRLPQNYPLCRAASISKNPGMLAFVHDECGIELSVFAVRSMGINVTRRHVEYVFDKVTTLRANVRVGLFEQVVLLGSFDAVEYMVDDCSLWGPQLLTQSVLSPIDAMAKVTFVYERAVARAERLLIPLRECLDLDVTDLLGLVVSGSYIVTMWLLTTISEDANPSALGDSKASDIPFIETDLVAPASTSPTTLSEVHVFLLGCIALRPESSRKIRWLPEVAVRLDFVDMFQRLDGINHPGVWGDATRNAIVKYSRSPRFMVQWLSAPPNRDRFEAPIVQWAAKYALLSVLTLLCHRAASATPDEQLELLLEAVKSAAMAGHVNVLEWVWGSGCVSLGVERSVVFSTDLRSAWSHDGVQRWMNEHLQQSKA